jgi:hypothetical protein
VRFLITSMLVVGLGCSQGAKLKAPPVNISGNVTQGSRPVGGVAIVFQPLGDGHMREIAVHKDGTFSGELVSGEYAYYVAKPAQLVLGQPAAKLAAKYFQADLSRTITVEPDKLLAIALD